jgi:hypothetical protein
VEAGGMTPDPSVDSAVSVLLPTVKVAFPEVTINTVSVDTSAVEAGGMTPDPSVDSAVSVLLLTAKVAFPDVTTNTVSVDTSADGVGGTTPESSVLVIVTAEPEIVITTSPPVMVVISAESVDTVEFDTGTVELKTPVVDGGGMTPALSSSVLVDVEPEMVNTVPSEDTTVTISSTEAVEEGGTTSSLAVETTTIVLPETVAVSATGPSVDETRPSEPVAVGLASEKNVVTSSPLLVVDTGTNVGVGGTIPLPTTPLPPAEIIWVEFPEIIVVTDPRIMVVIVAALVMGVIGSCTMTRVRVDVHSHEVAYTAHQ